MQTPSFALALAATFEQHAVSTLTYKGQPVWFAREIGRALGYGNDGRQFVTNVSTEWTDEFDDESCVIRVPLSECQNLGVWESPTPNTRGGHRGDVILLTERGVWTATLLSRSEAGKRLRRWLASEVLPKLARGEAVGLGTAKPAPLALPEHVQEAAAWMDQVGDRNAYRSYLEQWHKTFAPGELATEEDLLQKVVRPIDPWWATSAPPSLARRHVRHFVRSLINRRSGDLAVVQVKTVSNGSGIWTLVRVA